MFTSCLFGFSSDLFHCPFLQAMTLQNATENDELANKTIRRIHGAMEKGPVVGMPEVIRLIQELSTKAFSITINELAEIIEQDVAVTAKVIGSANTVGYNPTGTPVNTVSQSIQVIGFERVRNLALSLLLAENVVMAHNTEEQREVAAFALSSGLMAQTLMESRGGDPEQAFVCASLRSYGRLLLTTFFIDEYRQAMELAVEKGEERAFREVFGLTPIELSNALLRNAQLPRDILRTIQKLPFSLVNSAPVRQEDELLVIADFSVKLCELAMDTTLAPEAFAVKAESFTTENASFLRLDRDDIQDAFKSVLNTYNGFSQTYGLRRSVSGTMRVLSARAREEEIPADIGITALAGPHSAARNRQKKKKAASPASSIPDAILFTPPPLPESETDPEIILGAIHVLIGEIGKEKSDHKRVYADVVSAFVQALSIDDAVLMRRDANGRFKVLKGEGKNVVALRGGLESISAEQRDVFGLCLSRREDVLVEDATVGNVARYIPMWLKLNAPLLSLIILPVLSEGEIIGLLCGIRSRGVPLRINVESLQALRALRIHLATMWEREAADA